MVKHVQYVVFRKNGYKYQGNSLSRPTILRRPDFLPYALKNLYFQTLLLVNITNIRWTYQDNPFALISEKANDSFGRLPKITFS